MRIRSKTSTYLLALGPERTGWSIALVPQWHWGMTWSLFQRIVMLMRQGPDTGWCGKGLFCSGTECLNCHGQRMIGRVQHCDGQSHLTRMCTVADGPAPDKVAT